MYKGTRPRDVTAEDMGRLFGNEVASHAAHDLLYAPEIPPPKRQCLQTRALTLEGRFGLAELMGIAPDTLVTYGDLEVKMDSNSLLAASPFLKTCIEAQLPLPKGQSLFHIELNPGEYFGADNSCIRSILLWISTPEYLRSHLAFAHASPGEWVAEVMICHKLELPELEAKTIRHISLPQSHKDSIKGMTVRMQQVIVLELVAFYDRCQDTKSAISMVNRMSVLLHLVVTEGSTHMTPAARAFIWAKMMDPRGMPLFSDTPRGNQFRMLRLSLPVLRAWTARIMMPLAASIQPRELP